MKSIKRLLIAGTLLVSATASAGGTQIGSGSLEVKCSTDLSGFGDMSSGPGAVQSMSIELKVVNGKLAALVNGAKYNIDVQPEEYKVSAAAFTTDIENIDDVNLNDAEKRLSHISQLTKDPVLADMVKISFDIKKISSARLYDLDGQSKENMFGGVVLMDAFDENGNLLGRLLSSMLPGECR